MEGVWYHTRVLDLYIICLMEIIKYLVSFISTHR